MRNTSAALLAATLFAAPLGIPAPAAAQTLNVGAGGAFNSLDPHFFNLGPNNVLGKYIFSSLTEFSPTLRPEASLAISWTAISPNVWEFKLRPGVTFHDGTPLTADDVAFTFERIPTVPNSPASFNVMIKPVIKLEVIDALTIRMHTAGPTPVLPLMMVGPMILSRKIHTGATTTDFNSG